MVEVAGNAKPPVCRLIEFKKFKYLEAKKDKLSKKGNKETDTKEIRMGPFIGEHDLEIRIKRAEEFLKNGHKIKAIIKFSGRELGKKEFGFQILNKLTARLTEVGKVDRPAGLENRFLTTVLSPLK